MREGKWKGRQRDGKQGRWKRGDGRGGGMVGGGRQSSSSRQDNDIETERDRNRDNDDCMHWRCKGPSPLPPLHLLSLPSPLFLPLPSCPFPLRSPTMLRVLRPVTYLASGLLSISMLVQLDHAKKAARPLLLNVPVPPEIVRRVKQLAANMNMPRTDQLYVYCSRSLSAFSGGYPTRPGGAVLGLPMTHIVHSPSDPLWDLLKAKADTPVDIADVRTHLTASPQGFYYFS
eukprot:m.124515 g.124515  ORF g.124515 m.124515 type:complete len:230 (-) comp15596_c0_seq6:433-1122(-)